MRTRVIADELDLQQPLVSVLPMTERVLLQLDNLVDIVMLVIVN